MVRMFNLKKVMVISVAVFVLSLMQMESFAGEDWEVITQFPTKRWGFSTAVVDDKIYIIGGTLDKNFGGPYGLSTVEVYDTQINAWQRLTDMPTPRQTPQAAVVNGIIYVFGGFSSKDRFIQNWKLPVHVEAYDPATDTWTRKKDMPISRINFGLGVVAGKVYLIGGSEGLGAGDEQRMDRVDVYDPETDTWAKGPKMPTRRDPGEVEVVSNRIYVIGGYGWPAVFGGPLVPVIEEYDPISDQWHQKKDMLDFKDTFGTVVEDDIYLIGGFAHGKFVATVDVYNPQKETWRNIPELPTPMSPYGAATVNGKIIVLGGLEAGGQFSADVVAFDTGFRAVDATGKMSTRWGELKEER